MNRTRSTSINLSICVMAVAGIASPTLAQNYILRLENGLDTIDTTAGSVTFTIDVVGDAEEGLGTHMLWGSFALETSGSAVVENITWTHADWSVFNIDSGYSGGGDFSFIEFGQWEFDGMIPIVGSELGNRIGSFEITLAQSAFETGTFEMSLVSTVNFSLSTIDADSGASYYSEPESLVLQGFSSDIVPGPGSSVLLIGAGLFGIWRRR